MKSILLKRNIPKLSPKENKEVKEFYLSRGYKLKNTYWHRFYKGINGEFHIDYIPYDIFNPRINPRLNQRVQWPALLDKNFTYRLFSNFNQPKCIVQNINGFYFVNDELVNINEAIIACKNWKTQLIIKPTIDTGGGKMVNSFRINKTKTTYKNLSIEELFKLYKKDFVIQEFLEQSKELKTLNPTSLNTIRMVSYLNQDGVHILTGVLRVGKHGRTTDNYSTGGLFCGISEEGELHGKGYNSKGRVYTKTSTNVSLEGFKIPNYNQVKSFVVDMHFVVPYFKIISWDIGLNKDNSPYLIEYNTHNQGIDLQMASGPLFGKFTDEILALGLEPN